MHGYTEDKDACAGRGGDPGAAGGGAWPAGRSPGHCVTSAIEQGGPDAQAKIAEAAQAISRLVKS